MTQNSNSGGDGSRKVRDVMTVNPETVSQQDNILQAARIMRDSDTGVVPVVDGKKIIGLITDRDIVVRGVADGKNPSDMHVTDIMTRSIRSLSEDDTVDDALNLMSSAQVRRLPVVNSANDLVGIVSMGDISTSTNRDGKVGKAVENISEAPPNN